MAMKRYEQRAQETGLVSKIGFLKECAAKARSLNTSPPRSTPRFSGGQGIAEAREEIRRIPLALVKEGLGHLDVVWHSDIGVILQRFTK